MQFSFGMRRLLLAVAVFGAAFAFAKPHNVIGILIALLIAIPIAGIVLVARIQHVRPMVRTFASCGVGMILGLLLCPTVHRPYQHGNEVPFMMFGAIAAWFVSVLLGSREHFMEEAGQPEHSRKVASPPPDSDANSGNDAR